jgi:hypothetical protein
VKLVAITRILNEADIVEAFVRHTAALVDHHVLLDNGSTDGTLDILIALQTEGFSLEILHHTAIAFAEQEQLTTLARLVVAGHGADWIMPLDTDEFISFSGPDAAFRTALSAAKCDLIRIRVREYVTTLHDDVLETLVPRRIIHAHPESDNYKVMISGELVRQRVVLHAGAHDASFPEDGPIAWSYVADLVYAHFAVRSPWQWISKFTIGWSKVLAAGPATVAAGHAQHYREPFEKLKTSPAHILLDPHYMAGGQMTANLDVEPIWYRGGVLRYTKQVDYSMRAVSALMVHLESISVQYAKLNSRPK